MVNPKAYYECFECKNIVAEADVSIVKCSGGEVKYYCTDCRTYKYPGSGEDVRKEGDGE